MPWWKVWCATQWLCSHLHTRMVILRRAPQLSSHDGEFWYILSKFKRTACPMWKEETKRSAKDWSTRLIVRQYLFVITFWVLARGGRRRWLTKLRRCYANGFHFNGFTHHFHNSNCSVYCTAKAREAAGARPFLSPFMPFPRTNLSRHANPVLPMAEELFVISSQSDLHQTWSRSMLTRQWNGSIFILECLIWL